ncbi:hypothetical protein ACSZNJ_07350 [Aeromonas hydrophila]|uniref:hypothetical protein n=1 Tax=Aeromonas hydrophila TaxID=644 RepID=UPI003EC92F25
MENNLFIEDHVVPQLFTSAIEAYEFEHRAHKNGKAYSELETFGLLWGYSIPKKDDLPAKIISTMSTIETSATRHNEWVKPDIESILAKNSSLKNTGPVLNWSVLSTPTLTLA